MRNFYSGDIVYYQDKKCAVLKKGSHSPLGKQRYYIKIILDENGKKVKEKKISRVIAQLLTHEDDYFGYQCKECLEKNMEILKLKRMIRKLQKLDSSN